MFQQCPWSLAQLLLGLWCGRGPRGAVCTAEHSGSAHSSQGAERECWFSWTPLPFSFCLGISCGTVVPMLRTGMVTPGDAPQTHLSVLD